MLRHMWVLPAIAVLLLAAQAASAADNNLVKKGDFPSFDAPWGTGSHSRNRPTWWNSRRALSEAASVTTTVLDVGIGTALEMENRSARELNRYGTTAQMIPAKRNTDYRIGLWAKGQGLGSDSAVLIAVDKGWRTRPIRLPKGDFGWRYFAATFRTREPRIELRILMEDVGRAWITGITVHEVREGIAHVQYDYAPDVQVNAFLFDPSQLVIFRDLDPERPGRSLYTDAAAAIGAKVLVNGTFVSGEPTQAFGDFVLNWADYPYAGAESGSGVDASGNRIPKDYDALLRARKHFAVRKAGGGLAGVIGPGRIAAAPGPVRTDIRWAIGGLGAIMPAGGWMGPGAGQGLARTVIGYTVDKKVILMTIGQGAARNKGCTIQQAGIELKRLGAVLAANLDGGSATLCYYDGASPSLLANPSGYRSNWSFVGAKAGGGVLPAATSLPAFGSAAGTPPATGLPPTTGADDEAAPEKDDELLNKMKNIFNEP